MNFIIDNQLPPALARFLESELKVSALHVVDLGMQEASDTEVWRFASDKNSVLISKDEDFATIVIQVPTARLIWVRIGNCRKQTLLDLFRQTWPRIVERLNSGDHIIEVR